MAPPHLFAGVRLGHPPHLPCFPLGPLGPPLQPTDRARRLVLRGTGATLLSRGVQLPPPPVGMPQARLALTITPTPLRSKAPSATGPAEVERRPRHGPPGGPLPRS